MKRRILKITLLTGILLMALMVAGCGKNASDNAPNPTPVPDNTSNPVAEEPQSKTRIVTDMVGNEVEIPTEINRVVNLWPASNAAMLALGAGDKIIATTDFTKGLHWSKFVYPQIVDVPTGTENAEELLQLEPDLIITPTAEVADALRNAGLPAVMMFFNDYDSMKQAFTILGDIFGGEYVDKAAKWTEMVDNNIARVQAAVGNVPEDEKPVVYYIQGQTNKGLYTTFAANSIMQDWVENAGGVFASTLLELKGSEASAEAVLALNPDVVIIGGPAQHVLYDTLMADAAWKDIDAVKNGRIYTNPNGLFPWERFGLESALQIPFAASVIHPDLFEVDLVAEVQDFYREFVGIELTKEQAQFMIDGYGPNGEDYDV